MDFIFEFILEIAFGFGTDRKVSKWIRYPLAILAISFSFAMIGILVWIGIEDFETSIGRSVASWLLAIFLTVLVLLTFINSAKKTKKK